MDDGARTRILIVEDEWLIADLLTSMLTELGYDVVGPASSVGEALSLIHDQAPDAALLDVSLGEAKSFAIAEEMTSRGTPFLFLTGYVESDLPVQYRACPIITKPVTIADLRAPLKGVVASAGPAAAGF